MENVNCPRCGVSTPELPGPFGKFCGNCEPAARAGCRILDHGFKPAAPPPIPTSKYPELDEISKDLAYAVSMEIPAHLRGYLQDALQGAVCPGGTDQAPPAEGLTIQGEAWLTK